MNILQFNVRLAEGGAAGVALDLHQRALQQGLASHFVYGYGKGGKESVSHQNLCSVIFFPESTNCFHNCPAHHKEMANIIIRTK